MKDKMFFFSDAHICDGSRKDDFSQKKIKDGEFIGKMEMVRKEVDKIVGVGDIYELWQTSHNKIMNAHYIQWAM